MCHKLPPPLTPRTFPVLVVTALENDTDGEPRTGIVVHIPIDISSFPLAMYSNGRNIREGTDNLKRKKVVLGYAAHVLRLNNLSQSKLYRGLGLIVDGKGASSVHCFSKCFVIAFFANGSIQNLH